MFTKGDTITVNLPNGHRFTGAILLKWSDTGIMVQYQDKFHFLPWHTVWSVTRSAAEAIGHAPTPAQEVLAHEKV